MLRPRPRQITDGTDLPWTLGPGGYEYEDRSWLGADTGHLYRAGRIYVLGLAFVGGGVMHQGFDVNDDPGRTRTTARTTKTMTEFASVWPRHSKKMNGEAKTSQ